ncbi:MAG: hypothetical protein OES57_08610 [Acidimicrobiia bacterium]|nr:hypothetical protein [Acidimicrobiia bacterium]
MDVTPLTWIVALVGLGLMLLLAGLQLVAVLRPRAPWTIANVYGGSPDATDATAYFAYNQGYAWADVFLWAPVQILASVGMLLGQRWGFLLALVAAVPYCYTAITIFVWDRDLGFRQPTATYWIIVWAMWPAYGLVAGVYCFVRLL